MPDKRQPIDTLLARNLAFLLQRGGVAPDGARIRSRQQLAHALGCHVSAIARWCKDEIPVSHHASVRAMFGIDPAWLLLPEEAFRQKCGGIPVPSWDLLLERAETRGVGRLVRTNQLMPAIPHGLAPPPVEHPVVRRGTTFRVQLLPPQDPRGGVSWLRWGAVVVSRDVGGEMCLMPRYSGRDGLPAAQIPPTGALDLVLDEPADSPTTGLHALVLVAHKDPLPPELDAQLREERSGIVLRETLDLLARVVLPRQAVGTAGIRRWDYRVAD